MFNLYELNKQINDLLPKVAQKYDLGKVFEEMYCPNWISSNGGIIHISDIDLDDDSVAMLEAPQIRQILLALKDVLGDTDNLTGEHIIVRSDDNGNEYPDVQPIFETKSDALCTKWLDSLNPLIDREPETVLTELVDVLNQLLN